MRKLLVVTTALIFAIGACDKDKSKSAQGDANLSINGSDDACCKSRPDTNVVLDDTGQNRTVQDSSVSIESIVPHDAGVLSVEKDAEITILDSTVDTPTSSVDGSNEALGASDIGIGDGSDVFSDALINDTENKGILSDGVGIWVEFPKYMRDMALDETSLYVSYGDGYLSYIDGGLLQMDIPSETATHILEASCQTGAGAGRVPFPDNAVGECSGDRQGIVGSLALDSTHLYFTSLWYENWAIPAYKTNAMVKMDRFSNVPVDMYRYTNISGFGSIATDDTRVYFTTTQKDSDSISWELMTIRKEGGFPVNLASGGYDISKIVVDDTSVYWMNREDKSIWKLDKNGGNPVNLVSEPGSIDPYDPLWNDWFCWNCIAVDERYIYFGNWYDGAIKKVDKDGGEPDVVVSADCEVRNIVVDETDIYWWQKKLDDLADDLTVPTPEIMKVNKSGGSVTRVIYGQAVFKNFIVDDEFIYWTTGNAIKRIEK